MSVPLLQLSGLSGGYPPVSVFRDVNLAIEADEAVGLFGPNGHGKTTLMKTIAGLLDPWKGEVRFGGDRLNAEGTMRARISRNFNFDLFVRRRIRARDVVKAGLIYVMQGNLLFPEMTVREVLDIAPRAAVGRVGIGEMRETVQQLFPRLHERRNSKIRYLSGGERQMVSIAVGLLALPRLLVLDEPTLGLSPKLRLELADSIGRIRESNVPLLVIDQNVGFLTDLVDRLYLFAHGTITAEIDKNNMPDHDEIMALIFGSEQ